ncbi:MAG TPA: ATP-binding protein [Candidatus Acidoferrales bacterium]|nr:ATP-binding protein [Candidatus Acidoferrales bacterium]
MREPVPIQASRFLAAFLIAAGIPFFYHRFLHVSSATAALTLVLAILAVSTVWGIVVSVSMSVVATFAFVYYFLERAHKVTFYSAENWVTLLTFLVVSILASHLSSRARQQASFASARRRDIEKLYAFSQSMLESGNVIELLNRIPAQIVQVFELGAAALLLAEKQKVYRSGPVVPHLDLETLKSIAAREELVIDAANSVSFVPVKLGARPIGSLGISGTILSRGTLEALGTLVAVAMERARAVEQLGQTEATREGERLRTALLDSVTHALRTPLTSIKGAVTNLLSNDGLDQSQKRDLLTVIDEESDRLNRLVGEAAEMSQLDSGNVDLKIESHSIDELISAALLHCRALFGSRSIDVRIAPGLPQVRVDLPRATEVLVQLLENANQYSPPDQPITITAERSGDYVLTSVADHGSGIDGPEQDLIFEKFYRGRDQRYSVQGTGMGLPIAKAIVEAHSGTISLTSQRGQGSVFSFTLPADGRRPPLPK